MLILAKSADFSTHDMLLKLLELLALAHLVICSFLDVKSSNLVSFVIITDNVYDEVDKKDMLISFRTIVLCGLNLLSE
jgi:hypothetical protein